MNNLFGVIQGIKNGYVKREKRSRKIPYSDYLLSFDIETSTWEDGTSSVYVWSLAGGEYTALKECTNNSDLEKVCEVCQGRTLSEFDLALDNVNEAAETTGCLILVLVYNLSFEWSYIQKNCEFFRKNYDPDYPTVLEGRHNIMSIKAGNLVFLDATRIFGLGSLKNNAGKYGFEKLEYDYDVKRHSQTPLMDEDYKYNANDTLITLGAWAKRLSYGGYAHISNPPLTATMMIRASLKGNSAINKVNGHRIHAKRDRRKPRKQKEATTLFDDAVNIAGDVFSNFELEGIASFLEKCFSGGYSHCNIFAQGNLYYNVGSADLTSAYPGAMLCEWYPRKLKEVSPDLQRLEFMLQTYHGNLAKYTRSKLKAFFICEVKLIGVSAIRYKNEKGEFCMPMISIHKVTDISKNCLIDNGKVLEAEELTICCSSIDLATWRKCYKFDIESCYKLIVGYDIQRLPEFWLNSVKYAYKAKNVMKKTIKLYTEGEDWQSEFQKIEDVDSEEVQHVESMTDEDGLQYLNMLLFQRKAELNGLYGIMVMHIIRAGYQYNEEKEVVRVEDDIRNPKDGTNYLWGIIVTSIVRLWECEFSLHAFEQGCTPIYWDTDSCKCVVPGSRNFETVVDTFNDMTGGVDSDFPEIGQYDCEEVYLAFKSLGSKRYIYFEKDKNGNPKCRVTIAGLPKRMYAGFLTDNLQRNIKFSELNEAIKQTAYYFKPNMYVSPDSTDKLIPKYFNEEKPSDHILTDHLGVTITETYYSGATLTSVPFAIMSLDSVVNRDYQSLCDKVQGRTFEGVEPLTVTRKDGKYIITDGKLEVPDIYVYMMQQDMEVYQ